ncbi:HEAT repeat domain-containing protein [Singulisphaera sp. Ch08]|uniref:HEAT repeat domain-containing protein n=1 Tax=Singulisphaera sp. Ch08 TaxID=3120278 RepID=A0AAU7CQ02_9BACT
MPREFPKPRLSLRMLIVLVAFSAIAIWAGLFFLSPTRRFTRQLQAQQPAYLRREAAIGLGYGIPTWESGEAIGVLLGAINDPSPRVRVCVAAGLGAHGRRAESAIPSLLALLSDQDWEVRYAAAAALGAVIGPVGDGHDIAMLALARALQDHNVEVRLSAARSLIDNGEFKESAATLAVIMGGTEEHLRSQIHLIRSRLGANTRLLIPGLATAMRDKDVRTRKGALELLLEIAPPSTVRAALRVARREGAPDIRQWASEKLERLTPATDSDPE